MEKIRVLFVDDDESLLSGLRRSLRRKARDWNIQFADSGASALDLMKANAFDVIISDMRMPQMNGVELLTEVKKMYPNTVRFVLSGYSDKQMILNSVGLTHQFFSKPCDPEHLIQAVNYSNSLYKRIGSIEVQEIVCGIKNLPTPPETYAKINEELKKEDPSVETISEVVKGDTAISAKILQLVNSAFFGIGGSVSDISQATMFLGVENLKSLVLIVGMTSESFQAIQHEFAMDLYTQHSIKVGTVCEKIARELGMKQKHCQAAFTAGLIHDIGKLVMAMYFSTRYSAIEAFGMHTPDTEKTQDLENDKFGINHADIGAALVGLWGLPPAIVNAVAFHHKPQEDVDDEEISLATIVHIANAIVLDSDKNDEESILNSDLLNQPHIQSLNLENNVLDWKQFANE